jgi:hypothetical protein
MQSAQELWVSRLIAGTWTPDHLVTDMQRAALSAAKAIAEYQRLIDQRSPRG